ncbi:---NA--- [Podarcis lilfordi]|uniref:---NA n=1 Tax=Podarcis lilfordi TaxID=74358 RepID=A0AA35QQB5_9SAUR|nr:---NA--- [Podarcis lilfordi]
MWKELQEELHSHFPSQNSYRGETLSVCGMWKELQEELQSHFPSKNSYREKPFQCLECGKSFTDSSANFSLSIKEFIQGRNPISVWNVERASVRAPLSLPITEFIQGRNPISVWNVERVSGRAPLSLPIKESVQSSEKPLYSFRSQANPHLFNQAFFLLTSNAILTCDVLCFYVVFLCSKHPETCGCREYSHS